MDTKEVLKQALENLKKERRFLKKENRAILGLRYAVKVKDRMLIRRFERKASRYESRIHNFEENILKIVDFLRSSFPNWNQALFEIEEKLKLYDNNILKRVSYVDGTIIKLIKQANWDQINIEVDKVVNEGIRPLAVLLNHLEDEFKRIAKEGVAVEEKKEEAFEATLNKQPFIIPFHSANEKEFANNILFVRHELPEYYMGRKLEYVFEVDYFWIEHHGKISGYFGHALPGMIPRNARKILGMRHGETSAENILKRKGLLLPKWMFARAGKIKLMIEIKSGWGSRKEALEELVRMARMYHLENNIMFLAFSAGTLAYLKQRLPNSFTLTNIIRIPGLGRLNIPIYRSLRDTLTADLFPSPKQLPYIDVFITPSKSTEEKVIKQIKQTTADGKYFIGGKVRTKEKLDWLVKHGARGAFIWASPETTISWLLTPPEQT